MSDSELTFSLDALVSVGEIALRYIQENSRDKINAAGDPLPVSKSKAGKRAGNVDLYNTGRLLFEDISYDIDAESATVVISFNAPYASDVDDRYNFAGIPPQKMDAFIEEITPFLQEGVSWGGADFGNTGFDSVQTSELPDGWEAPF